MSEKINHVVKGFAVIRVTEGDYTSDSRDLERVFFSESKAKIYREQLTEERNSFRTFAPVYFEVEEIEVDVEHEIPESKTDLSPLVGWGLTRDEIESGNNG